MKNKHAYILLGIILLAIFFRFYLIREIPGGLFPDEAANGLDINLMEQGTLQPFYERGNGREALFFYLLWGSVAALGRGAWQHHIVSGLIGVLSILGCFMVTRLLFSSSFRRVSSFANNWLNQEQSQVLSHELRGTTPAEQGTQAQKMQLHSLAETVLESKGIIMALLASFLMAVSTWHIVLSRTAFRAILIPLATSITLYFGLKIFAEREAVRKFRWAILFGVTFGLGLYTYIVYRTMIPILFVLVLWPLLADLLEKPRLIGFKRYFLDGILALLFLILTIAPLGYYFYTHPDFLIGRSGQVSVFNPELNGGHLISTVVEVTKESFLSYFNNGDLNWRHNISGQPFLSPIISPFFALGLLLVTFLAIRYFFRPIKYAQDFKHFLLSVWFYGMLIPVITTAEGIPHGLRSIGTIPPVFIITAYGLYMLVVWITKLLDIVAEKIPGQKTKILRGAFWLLAAAFIISLPLQTYRLYFIHAYNNPENFYAFRSDLTPVSAYLKERGNKHTTYLILDKFSIQTVDYLTTVDAKHPNNPKNQPYTQVDPEESWRNIDANKDGKPIWPYSLKPGDEIVFTQSSIFDIKKFKEYHPNSALIKEVRNKFGQAVLAIYQIQ